MGRPSPSAVATRARKHQSISLCSGRNISIRGKEFWEQLWAVGLKEMDHDRIISHPQVTRFVVKSMHRTGLLRQSQYVGFVEADDDEATGLAAMDLGLKNGY